VRHNVENGKIILSLKDNNFTISNSGALQSLDEAILFKRFGKGSSDTRSSGLGLAIVKEICDRYGWQVSYKFEDGLHYFSVSF
jgi:signal transduction histidine kinase